MTDVEECLVLERLLLSPRQREVLTRRPRWDLDPPQREEYSSPRAYVLGLRAYADRVLDSDFQRTCYGKLQGVKRHR